MGRGRKTATAILREIENSPVERAPQGACFDREGEKDRFATLMQYQGAVPEVKKRGGEGEALRTRTKHYCPPGSNKGMHEGDVDWQKRFGELAKDVEENQAFLERMEAAGQVLSPLPLHLPLPPLPPLSLLLPPLPPLLPSTRGYRSAPRPPARACAFFPCAGKMQQLEPRQTRKFRTPEPEMRRQGHVHRAVINGTIAERYREMREIDKKLEERAANK